MKKQKLVIVGAGPIGLETALRGILHGYDVTVLERGCIGQAIQGWGHVKLFTPFSMNSTETGRNVTRVPIQSDEILTGSEFVERYLNPLARCEQLKGRVHENHEVLNAGRQNYGKSDRIGQPHRNESPFRILVGTPDGDRIVQADVLIDCTGFVSLHRHLGAGGIPCPNERLLTSERYHIPDVLNRDRSQFTGRHTLVVGSGYSAATSVELLSELAQAEPATKVTWITRGNRREPIVPIPDDPLPERIRLTQIANQLAVKVNNHIDWKPGRLIEDISLSDGKFEVRLSPAEDNTDNGGQEALIVDRIIANVGHRPDPRPFEELQIHRCYATDGPIKMAAHLLGESSADCLQQSSGGWNLLKNPEPDFYVLGAASYGRDSRFLLQTGLQQVEELFQALQLEQSGVTS